MYDFDFVDRTGNCEIKAGWIRAIGQKPDDWDIRQGHHGFPGCCAVFDELEGANQKGPVSFGDFEMGAFEIEGLVVPACDMDAALYRCGDEDGPTRHQKNGPNPKASKGVLCAEPARHSIGKQHREQEDGR